MVVVITFSNITKKNWTEIVEVTFLWLLDTQKGSDKAESKAFLFSTGRQLHMLRAK